MLITIIVFIVILGVLVLVHEAGHFFVAKRNGVRSDEFGFGYPPRIFGIYKSSKGQRKFILGNKPADEVKDRGKNTIYSINWIPIGGFVKIHGEDGENKKDPKSFSNKSIWKRFKILFAGSGMNLVFGVLFLAVALQLGLPQQVSDDDPAKNAKVQIASINKKSPAEEAGVKMGDIVLAVEMNEEKIKIDKVGQLQEIIKKHKGSELTFVFQRLGEKEILEKSVYLRENYPEGQGSMGVMLARVAEKQYGFFQSFWIAISAAYSMIATILWFLGDLIVRIFSEKPVVADVAGPVGIAVLTGQMAKMGIAYLFNFAAILSINLAVINLFPLPALDGGRILFLLIEKIKGSPVSQRAEGIVHTIGFFVLMGLMVLVTVKDFINFEVVSKIRGLF